ncbi:hypothetical protein G1K75_12715 [Tenacibaculum finnmarkense]|uniref:hypothetical protein n=1 Tax=Tenacibaculum finnmarkense TaxID=2781243 RepID=UPI00187B4B03|nr:hypothetical protein [Tenacibaculum finnmarkense]MBE7635113.1 hypothetical protein [Tenacibaculum finnmarkense genomovar ulcerans]MCD8403801.1 hypothetical protein [Tenacibaculum finnmarkense genomovar finnmarkense]MCD8431116.1 hypothetical protein [Tenacibaculum finnmarkense genomovar ulcerans]MCD8433602.1 hypothetical protein [Tenacibaculum finnmarkense genomovar ulcerans]MCG8806514.1 hypothetical protein [Tenacibaculum finnmarkense]
MSKTIEIKKIHIRNLILSFVAGFAILFGLEHFGQFSYISDSPNENKYGKPLNLISYAVDLEHNPLKMLSYETKDKEEFLSLKEECLSRGYSGIKLNSFGEEIGEDDRAYSECTNGVFKVSFIVSNKPNNLGYSVAIKKIKN